MPASPSRSRALFRLLFLLSLFAVRSSPLPVVSLRPPTPFLRPTTPLHRQLSVSSTAVAAAAAMCDCTTQLPATPEKQKRVSEIGQPASSTYTGHAFPSLLVPDGYQELQVTVCDCSRAKRSVLVPEPHPDCSQCVWNQPERKDIFCEACHAKDGLKIDRHLTRKKVQADYEDAMSELSYCSSCEDQDGCEKCYWESLPSTPPRHQRYDEDGERVRSTYFRGKRPKLYVPIGLEERRIFLRDCLCVCRSVLVPKDSPVCVSGGEPGDCPCYTCDLDNEAAMADAMDSTHVTK